MSRPPGNADQLMIAAGMELARKNGCSSLRIREVVDRAGVNLGMFHYHFKNRGKFTRILLEEVYGEFFAELTELNAGKTDPLDQLRASLILKGRFLRNNRRIVFALFKDVINGEAEVLRYTRKHTPPHIAVIQDLFHKCHRSGLLPNVPLDRVVPLFFGALVQPILLAEMTERSGKKMAWFDFDAAMSDEAIADRLDIIFRGLKETKR